MNAIKGYIFDLDHTLLESDEAQIGAALLVLNNYGIIRTRKDVLEHFDKPTDKMMEALAGSQFKGTPSKLGEEHTEAILQMLDKIRLYPKVNEILKAINKSGNKIAIASNNYRSVIEAIIHHFGWTSLITAYVGIDDVSQGKPHPEMIVKCCQLMNLSNEQCTMVGDSIYDMMAAKDAGCQRIAVCTGSTKKAEFENIKVPLILDRIEQLLPLIS
jgi:pyrophosphatase PpaX